VNNSVRWNASTVVLQPFYKFAGCRNVALEREIPKPGAGHMLIKVQAYGVCHSDVLTKEGAWPGLQ
jgi:D-arabinose 1-dehydrogenase-like Zn-dependent alcohol dehydrogenase